MTTIARPQGVRIVHPDGTETPIELTYTGVQDGQHVWSAFAAFTPGADVLRVDVMPARTTIRLPSQSPQPRLPDPGRRADLDRPISDPVYAVLGVAAAAYLVLLVALVVQAVWP